MDRIEHDAWTELLSEYLDGELGSDRCRELEAHLRACAPCTSILDELAEVTVRARSLEERMPQADLWPGIARRIAEAPPARVRAVGGRGRVEPRRFSFTMPQLVAAGLLLALVSGGAVYMTRMKSTQEGSGNGALADLRRDVASNANTQDEERTIRDLRRALDEGKGSLDTTTVRVLEQNLALVEQSIAQAKAALDADPNNPYLREHLEDTMKRKVDLLKRATLVASIR